MIDQRNIFSRLSLVVGEEAATHMLAMAMDGVNPTRWGDLPKWQEALANLPDVLPDVVDLAQSKVRIGHADQLNPSELESFRQTLLTFHPWRKGPYELFGLHLDTEWRSDWKWDRVLPHISPLAGRAVLDVGCGNGYHAWRMLGEGAAYVLGIDPTMVFFMQYLVMKQLLKSESRFDFLPLRLEQLPPVKGGFDTAFSMGVLYHRRAPVDHLYELKSMLRPGGELVLETLVIEGDGQTVMVPQDRYAQMKNVWFIPSVAALGQWLTRAGFKDVRVADVNQTSLEEQRSTPWMVFQSLKDFLDPDNPGKTVEGLPAPTRATLVATKLQ